MSNLGPERFFVSNDGELHTAMRNSFCWNYTYRGMHAAKRNHRCWSSEPVTLVRQWHRNCLSQKGKISRLLGSVTVADALFVLIILLRCSFLLPKRKFRERNARFVSGNMEIQAQILSFLSMKHYCYSIERSLISLLFLPHSYFVEL